MWYQIPHRTFTNHVICFAVLLPSTSSLRDKRNYYLLRYILSYNNKWGVKVVNIICYYFKFWFSCFLLSGKKTVIKAPKKLNSSVAYPFTMIKPFGVQEGVTLDDINAKIHAPPVIKKKLQHVGNFAYPISQFSGKPVVGKKKICTEGGKGSITILRTKGWICRLLGFLSILFSLIF